LVLQGVSRPLAASPYLEPAKNGHGDTEDGSDTQQDRETVTGWPSWWVRAARAVADMTALANHLGPVSPRPCWAGNVPTSDDLPYVTEAIGHLGTRASEALVARDDALLMIGTIAHV
jgi:hypothetical protein